MTPTVELGVRHDWGDAETGFGLELGGRVRYADPNLGLTIEAAVRGLLTHEDSDYQRMGRLGHDSDRSRPHGPGPLPDARPNLGRGVERDRKPLVAADRRRAWLPKAPGRPQPAV